MIRPPKSNSLWLPNLWLPEAKLMSPGYPCCCETLTDCGPCTSPHTDLVVDLGTSGWWTDGDCNWCDQPGGAYTASWNPVASPCEWWYVQADVCGTYDFFIQMQLIDDGGTYGFYGHVYIGYVTSLRSLAYYKRDSLTDADCWSEADGDGKLLLTKYDEHHWGSPAACSGTAPATIQIWLAT